MSNLAYIDNDYARGYVASQHHARRGVHVPLAFIDICEGNMHDAILFSQIMYWHEPSNETGKTRMRRWNDGNLWVAKNHDEWFKECRIKKRTARKCLDRLKALELIHYELHGEAGSKTPYIRINWNKFAELMQEWEVKNKKNKPENVVTLPDTTGHTPDTLGQGGVTQQDIPLTQHVKSNTETTSETTSETNNNARAHDDTSPDEDASVLVQEIDDSLKDIITLFKNVFPDYIERPDKPTFQQDAKKLQTLLDVHGYESLKLALEKCAGMTVQSPFAYLKTILEAPDHKQAVAVKEQTITAIVPYHQDAPVDNTPAMSDAEAQQALQEIRAQLKEHGVKFKALVDDETPEPDTQKDDAA